MTVIDLRNKNLNYLVNFHTGAGNFTADTLEEAMVRADEAAAYTQQDISIDDDNGTPIAIRRWYGVAYDPVLPEENPIDFGDFGFYADWCLLQ